MRSSWNKIIDQYSDLPIDGRAKYVLRHRDRARKSNRVSMSKRPKEYQRGKHLKSKFGITYEEFLAKLESQDNKCYICKLPLKPYGSLSEVACVDHDHKTDQIRDLLCNSCNVVLGKVQEKKETLQNMISYLDRWNSN